MGNDILTITHHQKKYIEHHKIPLPKHLQRTNSTHFQKIFGSEEKVSYLKSQSMPIFEVRSVSEEQKSQEEVQQQSQQENQQENTYGEINQLDNVHFDPTISHTFVQSSQSNDTIQELQNHVNELKQRLFEQNFNSRSFSPVKFQSKSGSENKTVNNTIQRSKQHYFRLKGCEAQNKQNFEEY